MSTTLKNQLLNVESVESRGALNYQYLLVVVLVLLAATLRLHRLGDWSFWIDEIITVDAARATFGSGFMPHTIPNRGVSLLMIGPVMNLLGVNEWSARLVPALAGIFSIPILFFSLKRVLGSGVALLAALLLATSSWHIYWSQNARYLTMQLLLYTLALLSFYYGVEENRQRYLVASLVLLAFATWERMYSLLFFLPTVVCYLILRAYLTRRTGKVSLQTLLLVFLPTLVLAAVVALAAVRDPSWLLHFSKASGTPFEFLVRHAYLSRPLIILMACLGIILAYPKKPELTLLLTLGAFVPVLATAAASLVTFTASRYAFLALPFWVILAGVGIGALFFHSNRNLKIVAIAVLAVLLLDSAVQGTSYYEYQHQTYRPNWKGAFDFVEKQMMPDDLVVTNRPKLGAYYLSAEKTIVEDVNLDYLMESNRKVWLVLLGVRTSPDLQAWVDQNSMLAYETVEVGVYLYDPETVAR